MKKVYSDPNFTGPRTAEGRARSLANLRQFAGEALPDYSTSERGTR